MAVTDQMREHVRARAREVYGSAVRGNPHEFGGELWREWWRGWFEAMEEDQGPEEARRERYVAGMRHEMWRLRQEGAGELGLDVGLARRLLGPKMAPKLALRWAALFVEIAMGPAGADGARRAPSAAGDGEDNQSTGADR